MLEGRTTLLQAGTTLLLLEAHAATLNIVDIGARLNLDVEGQALDRWLEGGQGLNIDSGRNLDGRSKLDARLREGLILLGSSLDIGRQLRDGGLIGGLGIDAGLGLDEDIGSQIDALLGKRAVLSRGGLNVRVEGLDLGLVGCRGEDGSRRVDLGRRAHVDGLGRDRLLAGNVASSALRLELRLELIEEQVASGTLFSNAALEETACASHHSAVQTKKTSVVGATVEIAAAAADTTVVSEATRAVVSETTVSVVAKETVIAVRVDNGGQCLDIGLDAGDRSDVSLGEDVGGRSNVDRARAGRLVTVGTGAARTSKRKSLGGHGSQDNGRGDLEGELSHG